jgi:hypothetical protein
MCEQKEAIVEMIQRRYPGRIASNKGIYLSPFNIRALSGVNTEHDKTSEGILYYGKFIASTNNSGGFSPNFLIKNSLDLVPELLETGDGIGGGETLLNPNIDFLFNYVKIFGPPVVGSYVTFNFDGYQINIKK